MPYVLGMVLANDNYKFKSPLINFNISLWIMQNHISILSKQMLFPSRNIHLFKDFYHIPILDFFPWESYHKFLNLQWNRQLSRKTMGKEKYITYSLNKLNQYLKLLNNITQNINLSPHILWVVFQLKG